MTDVIFTIFRKEMLDILRDRKTIMAGIILPVIFLPLSFILIGNDINTDSNFSNKINISFSAKADGVRKLLSHCEKFNLVEGNLEENLVSGKIHIALTNDQEGDLILIDSRRTESIKAAAVIAKYLDALYSDNNIKAKKRIGQKFMFGGGVERSFLSLIFPVIIAVFCAVAPLSAASDLFAGEKERSTIEPLFATPAGRFQILTAKYFAVSCIGIFQSFSFILGLFLSYAVSPEIFGKNFPYAACDILLIIISIIILTALFASAEVIISSYAKSSREAQTLSIPFLMIVSFSAYHVMFIEVPFGAGKEIFLPVIGNIYALKSVLTGIYSSGDIFLSFFFSCLYSVVFLFIAYFIFRREDMIFRS